MLVVTLLGILVVLAILWRVVRRLVIIAVVVVAAIVLLSRFPVHSQSLSSLRSVIGTVRELGFQSVRQGIKQYTGWAQAVLHRVHL